METKAAIGQAVRHLLDDLDMDPRAPLIVALNRAIQADVSLPDGLLRLQASIAPGGRHHVTDQHGREVADVKSVAFFVDNGQPVFQVNL